MKNRNGKKIFVVCPVRKITDEERDFIENYVSQLEQAGHHVHVPFRDTNQKDPKKINIFKENRNAIQRSDEIHVYWNSKSQGIIFDLGMSFCLGKPIVIMNRNKIKTPICSSMEKILLDYSP